jgi:hypothetical protein
MAKGIRNDRMMIQKNMLLTVEGLSEVSLKFNPGSQARRLAVLATYFRTTGISRNFP